ncbi:hypothetical protein AJ85_17080 [Alkalihalobacillus alcalophilus ATCC 27647 = CGMCC 1.3604]|uniref:SF3 helicase domain-containing protein n=1 Tax=Alkalihalobacillus alcalophilus ATCC 27647 = CGMCC 1.3604 TaxID=1218173 RepID=A0A4S4JXQ9_ALKAL|nr:hypothetical protein [Alkalihalobacillus alcalophilus]MED1561531.1 hypothetical protein [Alkalihalobacillus alcalophilus]THG89540.1 hypothetical protein AJ85_17080 [Alkalihalobacillus alcalophilus ATCC 27647 = CGMCC 1.3604]
MIDGTKQSELLSTLEKLKKDNEVIEVRILKTDKGTISGYFDDHDSLVQAVKKYIGKYDIYITLNPVKKELLARCKNRLQTYAKTSSQDGDIERIQKILIDIDPMRASGISSSEDEKKSALELVKKIRKDLMEEGFSEPVVADSGNGYHMLLAVDLDNTKGNVEMIKAFLAALDFLYSTDKAQVDVTTYNPSRIVKFYGTKACKGDNTTDRPHRWSKIVKVPAQLNGISQSQIQKIAAKKPKEEKPSKKVAKGKTLDVNEFIQKHNLDLAYSAAYGGNATKYILGTCPWNSDHTDNSAYIIQYDSGGLAAGCHHNTCSGENWKSLRDLVQEDEVTSVGEEEKQSDIIIKLAENFQYFRNDIEEPFVAIQKNGHWEVMEMKSQKFKLYLTKLYFEHTNSAPGSDAISQALKVLEMKAIFSDDNDERTLQKRIAEEDGSFYYDLCDSDWRVVKVNEEGCWIEENPPILFTRNRNMKEQVEPDFAVQPNQLFDLVKKHFRFKKHSDTVLFTTYLVSCFLPEIAHVILVLFGEKGAAKSTTMRMVKRIVDPAMQDLLSMPTSKSDLAIVLSNNYMPCFDNLDTLSAEKSDMLCMAATGGAFTKRTLYTDSDETILRFKRSVSLNGINIVATRPDLLDRSIVLELERIPKSERQSERTIWKSFEADIPKFLGAIFNGISEAIPQYDETELEEVGRMADFTYWGYAIAEVLGLGGDEFRKAYLSNQDTANEEALASHPVAAAVIALLKNTSNWSGSVSSLLKELERTAERERINTRVKTWAKDANVLSKRLKEVKSNLEEIGIYYDIRHAGDFKKITLEKHVEMKQEGGTGEKALHRPLHDEDDDYDFEEDLA